MAKQTKVSDSLISVELDKFNKKMDEFFKYLEDNKIKKNLSITDDNKVVEAHHKEIDTQIKMMDALLKWLPVLEKLREVKGESTKNLETRGDVELPGMFKNRS